MRLIDADALEELFRAVIFRIAKNPDISGDIEHMIRASATVIEMIQDAPSIEVLSAQQWIPCAERLPEEFKRVLCCTDKEEMFLARVYIFDNGYTFDDEEGMMWEGDVVAWMPLPSPYREEATDG